MRPENVAESRQTPPWGLRSGNETRKVYKESDYTVERLLSHTWL